MIVIAWKMISLPVPGRRTEQINFGYSDETLAWRARPVRAQCLADSYRNWRAKAGSRGASATSSLLGLGPCNAFCNTAGGWFRNRLSIAATAFLAFTGRARARQKCSRPVFTLSFSRVPAAATAASGFANSRRLHTHTYRSRFANESISTSFRSMLAEPCRHFPFFHFAAKFFESVCTVLRSERIFFPPPELDFDVDACFDFQHVRGGVVNVYFLCYTNYSFFLLIN